MKCRLNIEGNCPILNEKLGDCEIFDDSTNKVVWRCSDLIDESLIKKCPFCLKEIDENNFKNKISKKEFKISGLCQECQDATFGKD